LDGIEQCPSFLFRFVELLCAGLITTYRNTGPASRRKSLDTKEKGMLWPARSALPRQSIYQSVLAFRLIVGGFQIRKIMRTHTHPASVVCRMLLASSSSPRSAFLDLQEVIRACTALMIDEMMVTTS
jgi:hypothetical protein